MATIRVREINLDEMYFNRNYVIIGDQTHQKSELIRNIMRSKSDLVTDVTIFGGEKENYIELNNNFSLNFAVYSGEEIAKLEHRQKILRVKFPRSEAEDPTIERAANAIAVFDEPENLINQRFQQCLKFGRHWCLMRLISLQACQLIPANLRTAINYVFIFNHTSEKELERLYENYIRADISFPDFKELMRTIAGDHSCLVVDSNAADINECFFYYRTEVKKRRIEIL